MKFPLIASILLLTLIHPGTGYSQLYSTRTGFIGFYSKTAATWSVSTPSLATRKS